MDLNDLFQEHKSFFLATAIGVVLFIVGQAFISARFDVSGLERSSARARLELARAGRYGDKALRGFQEQAKQVADRLEQAQKLVLFEPRPEFIVAGEQYPERRYGSLAADTRRRILDLLEAENVRVDTRKRADMLGLPAIQPVERDAVQRTLIGLDLVERAIRLWVQGGSRARAADRRAHGLVSLDHVAIDALASRAQPGRGEAPPLDTIGARLTLTCGSRTVEHFLRLLQEAETPLQIEEFQAQLPSSGGEALEVTLRLVAPQLVGGV